MRDPRSNQRSAGPILVTGATGLVGRRLVPRLVGTHRTVRVLTRSEARARSRLLPEVVPHAWDGLHPPRAALAGAAAIVHLAGEPLFAGPLTRRRRARIRSSRVDATRALVEGLAEIDSAQRPRTLVCASAVGIYGSRDEEPLPESVPAGHGFLAELCCDWEEAARGAAAYAVRAVSLRIGIVLAREGGALAAMARAFRFGLGGRLGNGRQWVPWIHADDLARLVLWALETDGLAGPVNAVAPGCVRNAELTRSLAATLGRPALLPAPAWLLRAALGDLARELLDSRRVVPALAERHGFRFEHAQLASALAQELQ